ncbi:MAG: NAD-dependent deacylase [Hyphomicrobiaceae bacterium]
MTTYRNMLILTGAGLSAESGLATFRDKDGIWSKYRIEDVVTPEAFERDPERVQAFYNTRRRDHAKARPNGAHIALARLEAEHQGNVLVVTQNIDALHEAAGQRNLIHMHGELLKAWCLACDARLDWNADIVAKSACPNCGAVGRLRPDVVWFGEMPYHMDIIQKAIAAADLFISIGTSGNVYPAAGFVAGARRAGAQTVELNLEPSEGVSLFHKAIHGPATEVVPQFVERLLGSRTV